MTNISLFPIGFRRNKVLPAALALGAICMMAPPRAFAEEEVASIDAPYTVVKSPYHGDITAQAFSPDGRVLAVGMKDGTVALYELSTKRWVLHTKALMTGGVQAVALSPDGKWLAACGEEESVAIADARTGVLVRRLPLGNAALCLAFSPDGKTLAAGCGDESVELDKIGPDVQLWKVPGFAVHRALTTPGAVFAVSFSRVGNRLLAASSKSVVFALPLGKQIWSEDNLGARTASISPDGKVVGGGLGIWSISADKELSDARGQYNFSGFSASGDLLVCGSQEDGTSVFDGHTGRKLAELNIFDDFCALSPNGALIADGFGFKEIALYQVLEPKLRKLAYAREYPTTQ